jgi:short-subunit dehydrogenase
VDIKLKPLEDQVIVITGASSGIGLTTAQMAAEMGARVVLAARSRHKLERIVAQLRALGGAASCFVADVGDPDEVEAIADLAVDEFGGIDTWVNNASVGIYGEARDIDMEDAHRLFQVNYFGMVHGCLTAIPHLEQRGRGALINISSAVADRSVPLQSHYCAAKHAIKGFTESLRMELEKEGSPVSLTLVKPGSINTPFTRHAKNLMGHEANYPPPVYKPEVVARTILQCAVEPRRDVLVGGGAKMIAMLQNMPRIGDRYMERSLFDQQQKQDRPLDSAAEGVLYRPDPDEGVSRYGNYEGHVMGSSLYTMARMTSSLLPLSLFEPGHNHGPN